jgi:hypothetical protein
LNGHDTRSFRLEYTGTHVLFYGHITSASFSARPRAPNLCAG